MTFPARDLLRAFGSSSHTRFLLHFTTAAQWGDVNLRVVNAFNKLLEKQSEHDNETSGSMKEGTFIH
jgi:hypothetical protein